MGQLTYIITGIFFFRYLDVFTIHSGVSFPLLVLIHVNCIVYKNLLFLINGFIIS